MAALRLDIPEPQEGEESATEKQKGFIRALARETGLAGIPEATLQDLGKWQASSIIDQLQSFKKEIHGEKPLDTSRIRGLDKTGRGRKFVFWLVVILGLLILLGWLSK